MTPTIVSWADVAKVARALEAIQERALALAPIDFQSDYAAWRAFLREQAVELGLSIAAEADIVVELKPVLLASRDHEGELQQRANRATPRDVDGGIVHGGRRGWLDSAAYAIDRAELKLSELKRYEDLQAVREAAKAGAATCGHCGKNKVSFAVTADGQVHYSTSCKTCQKQAFAGL